MKDSVVNKFQGKERSSEETAFGQTLEDEREAVLQEQGQHSRQKAQGLNALEW